MTALLSPSRAAGCPRVSVVMPCYNEASHIRASVHSILCQENPEGGLEVIIADGMSHDGSREILKDLAVTDERVRLLDNPGRIASAGLNLAIRQARGDIIIRMDAHTEYAADYIRSCVAALEGTGADNVGGAARTKASRYVQRAVSAAYHCPVVVGGARFHEPDYEGFVDTVVYGCWRREAFSRFGLFDEELARNQDDEFNLRIVRNGGRIWQSRHIKSWYHPRTSLASLFKQYSQYGYWKVRVVQKHRVPASWRHLVPGLFVLALGVLGILSVWVPLALWLLLGMLGGYALLCAYAAIHCGRRGGWSLVPVMPAVVGCYHLAYGYGFVRGLFDFVIRRRGAASFSSISRT